MERSLPHGIRPQRRQSAPWADWLFFNADARRRAWLTLLLLAGIIVSLVYRRLAGDRAVRPGFPLDRANGIRRRSKFGALMPIYGTLITSLIALLIAVPVSFGIALFLTELSPAWLRRPLGTAIELLAGDPLASSTACGACWCSRRSSPSTCSRRCSRRSATCRCSARCSPGRRWASASCRPASSWRS